MIGLDLAGGAVLALADVVGGGERVGKAQVRVDLAHSVRGRRGLDPRTRGNALGHGANVVPASACAGQKGGGGGGGEKTTKSVIYVNAGVRAAGKCA